MPKQYTLLGRSLPRLSTRRLSFLLVCFSIFAVLSLLISLPNALSPDSQLTRYTEHIPKIPTIKIPFAQSVLNPFKQPSHPPPRQKNDTYDESSWWADWKWLSVPFSSSLTLDEDRSLLPPLKERPPIYCYYDATIKKDDALKDAESDLLLTWRRAWWAQGFRPVILSAAEAMQNPLFADVQRATLDAGLRADLMRWLAWENMGGGLLTYYTTLPMGSREDPLLASFRRAEYPKLTRWEKLGSGLLAGPQTEVAAAIKEILASDQAAQAKDLLAIVSKNTFVVDKKPAAIAWYDANTVEGKFAKVATAIVEDPAKGLRSLNQLINSHLHTTWQNTFTSGIAVLKPLPHHSTYMVTDAWDLAEDLSQCSPSPMVASCPPNNPNCSPCVSSTPMHIGTPARYRNSSTLYTIGTVPHPYTTAVMTQMSTSITVRWIRRESPRDPWLAAATIELLGAAVGGSPRVLYFKEAVGADASTASSLWLTAEKPLTSALRDELDWHFGFVVPQGIDRGQSETPVPGPERRPKQEHDPADGRVATEAELEAEPPLLARAVAAQHEDDDGRIVTVRGALEAWNLADTEAWRFARAFFARRVAERRGWEAEESKYAEGAGTEKGRRRGWGGRWIDDAKKDDDDDEEIREVRRKKKLEEGKEPRD
ncbi:hypothetical protein BJF96_g7954 [Verticillium dahliae]|uniref:Uncharacterized protein n=1 Tax=Verticillium dahliae TaxID=27337 RepID=A0AA45AJ99_VERDA|nr:hypothetical protein BJF96_g7954 [Verticillium dahliae]PNH51813.1 hypothetical protein VD0003_g5477 [Verticillium dahliae]